MFNFLMDSIDPSASADVKAALMVGVRALEIVCAILVGIVAYFVITKVIRRAMLLSRNKMPERKINTLSSILGSLTKYLIGFIVICHILTIFQIDPLSFIAVAGVGGIAIGFAAQNLVRDFITGAIILVEDQYSVGDVIAAAGCTGTVEHLGLRVTRIRSVNGDLHMIPNGSIGIVTNMSRDFKKAVVDIAIPLEADSEQAIRCLTKEMERIKKEYDSFIAVPQVLGITDFGGGSVKIRIAADCVPGTQEAMEMTLRRVIKDLLKKENLL